MVSLGDAYRDGFTRVDARARALAATDPDSLEVGVPACPDWSVRDVVAHLTGIAVDAVAGRLHGIPDDAGTAGQVADRAGRPVSAVLAEWAPCVEPIAAGLDARSVPVPMVADLLVHEGDLVEALGAPVPPIEGWAGTARLLCRGTVSRIDRPGTLTVRCGDDTWTGGTGGSDGPDATLEITAYEFFRGVFSRRSRVQMRAWAWDGDPDPWLAPLCVFGVRDDDQPHPEPRPGGR